MEYFKHPSGHEIAYRRNDGDGDVGVVFLGGFMSDMEGSKAAFLHDFCAAAGLNFVRFDYFGHGSSGGDFMQGSISIWKDDVLEVVARLTGEKRLILVGSSMGAWLMMLVAQEREMHRKIAGMIGIAAAPDFTADVKGMLSAAQRDDLAARGHTSILPRECNRDDAFSLTITRKLLDDGDSHLILGGRALDVPDVPVHLLHGMEDHDVPYSKSIALSKLLPQEGTLITLVPGADHRMSSPGNLTLQRETVERALRNAATC